MSIQFGFFIFVISVITIFISCFMANFIFSKFRKEDNEWK